LFKAVVSDAKTLRDLVTAISTLVDEATFNADENGVKLREMDPSRVAMIDFFLPKSAFEEYVCTEPTKICLNITEFLKLIKRAGKDEPVELLLDEKTGKLNITIKGSYTRTFNMPLLEALAEEAPTPRIAFNAKAQVTTSGIRQAIEDASLVSDHVKIEATNESLMMRAAGELTGATIELRKGSEALLNLEVKEESRATFSLNYLAEIIKAASATSEIATLEFSTDMPIRVDFKLPNEGILTYYLAPRIEGD